MLDEITKKRINTLRQILVGKLPDPKAQVEQITNGLIYKFMNDMDEQSVSLGGKASYFFGKFEKYSWKNLMNSKTSGSDRLELYKDAIEKMYNNENLPELFREIFKNSFLPFKDPSTLNMFLKEINEFNYSNSEKLGDAFEYLLSFMGSQGDAGQFRTPRHIIDFIVEIVNPQKNETILDPACGTAGFLISSYKYILNQNTKKNLGDGLTASDRKKIGENLNGYDISPDMVKMSLVNMYLHKFTNPKINEYDTLSSEERWNEYYDVILANPPFFSPKGGITPHNRFSIKSSRAEVLFVDYIFEHLKPNGRAGIIVPEGIIYQKNNAYKNLRKNLLDKGLVGVISLPPGIFQPYSTVKTSIIVIDKMLSKKIDKIFFSKINNDGFSLTSARKKTNINDLLSFRLNYHKFINGSLNQNDETFFECKKETILSNNDFSYNLNLYYKKKNTNSAYENTNIGELITESKERYNSGQKNVWSVSNKQGFVKPEEIFSHKISSDDIKNYKIVKKNYFAYNPSRVNVGSIALNRIKDNGYVSPMYTVFKNKDENRLNNEYLFLLLKSEKGIELILENSIGAIRNTLKYENLENIKIPLPDIEEQDLIVKKIDNLQVSIYNCNQLLKNYNPNIKFLRDWEQVPLEELCENFQNGLNFSSDKVGSGVKIVGVKDIFENFGTIDNSKLDRVNVSDKEIKSKKIKNNDLLFVRSSVKYEGVGYTSLVQIDNEEDIVFGGFVIKTSPKTNLVNPEYLRYVLLTSEFREKTIKLGNRGTITNISQDSLKSIEIPLPKRDEQDKIVKEINTEVNILKKILELREIYNFKKSNILQKIWHE